MFYENRLFIKVMRSYGVNANITTYKGLSLAYLTEQKG